MAWKRQCPLPLALVGRSMCSLRVLSGFPRVEVWMRVVASGLRAGPFPGGWVTYRSRYMVDCVARNAVPRSSADRPWGVRLCHARVALALRVIYYSICLSSCPASLATWIAMAARGCRGTTRGEAHYRLGGLLVPLLLDVRDAQSTCSWNTLRERSTPDHAAPRAMDTLLDNYQKRTNPRHE
jgi:hypothetical protein